MLPPEAYHSSDWYEKEKANVLQPAWWAVAFADELTDEGSFLTFDHCCGPLIIWRKGGVIRAFRNVCAHRLSRLTSQCRGYCNTLTCQYHGWEYDDSGKTKRIPDAPSFRPLEKDLLGLSPLHVEIVAGIIFVSFAKPTSTIRSCLGEDEVSRLETRCQTPGKLVLSTEIDIPVNWKVLLENNLESYHVGFVHRATLGNYPTEEQSEHKLIPRGSMFIGPGGQDAVSRFGQRLAKRFSQDAEGRYIHGIVHPTFMWVPGPIYTSIQTVMPTGPRSCRMTWRVLSLQDPSKNKIINFIARSQVRLVLGFWKRVVNEDVTFLPSVQAGLNSPIHPGKGLISRREERIVHFQKWLLEQMGMRHEETLSEKANTLPSKTGDHT